MIALAGVGVIIVYVGWSAWRKQKETIRIQNIEV